MCGILGVSNSTKAKLAKPAVASVFCKAAMDSLETRGYQSWGCTLLEPRERAGTLSARALGRITKVSSLDFSNASSVSQAICHTRIASAGAVTLDNAQPIVLGGDDGDETVVVHNGTINRERLVSSLVDDIVNLRSGRSSDSQAIAWFCGTLPC